MLKRITIIPTEALLVYADDDLMDFAVFKILGKKSLKVAVGYRIPKDQYDLQFDTAKDFLRWLKNF